MSQQKRIEAVKLKIETLQEKLANLQMSKGATTLGEVPYKVPPEGCKAGWYDNGHGYCVLDT